jgi:hypothetical protein
MRTSYRISLLAMLRPECTYIESSISTLEAEMREVKSALLNRARLHIYWLGILLALIIIGIITTTVASPLAALAAAFFTLVLTHFIANSPRGADFTQLIMRWPGFGSYHNRLLDIETTIAKLYEPAKRYQAQLEIESGPGLLSIYGDVITHDFFQCPIPRDQLILDVELSQRGEGREISVRQYGQIIQSLKTFDFTLFIDSKNGLKGVDILQAKARTSIAIQCAYLLANQVHSKSLIMDASIIKQIYFVGKNAWLTSSEFGFPEQWTPTHHDLFSYAGQVFDKYFNGESNVSLEYLNLVKRVKANNLPLATHVFDIA